MAETKKALVSNKCDAVIAVAIPKDLKRAFRRYAHQHDSTPSQMLRAFIQQLLSKPKTEDKNG